MLEWENRELKRANEIQRRASAVKSRRTWSSGAQPALGGGFHICRDLARLRLDCLRHRRLRQAHRRLAGRQCAQHRVCPRCPRAAHWPNLEAVDFASLDWVDCFNHQRLLGPIGPIRRLRPNNTSMPHPPSLSRRHDSNPRASGIPGAIQKGGRAVRGSGSLRVVGDAAEPLRIRCSSATTVTRRLPMKRRNDAAAAGSRQFHRPGNSSYVRR